MKNPPEATFHRILFVLHLGLSDLRYVAKAGRTEQAFDLADTLENIPSFLANWEEEHFEAIKKQLQSYQKKYSSISSSDYVKYLAEHPVAERF